MSVTHPLIKGNTTSTLYHNFISSVYTYLRDNGVCWDKHWWGYHGLVLLILSQGALPTTINQGSRVYVPTYNTNTNYQTCLTFNVFSLINSNLIIRINAIAATLTKRINANAATLYNRVCRHLTSNDGMHRWYTTYRDAYFPYTSGHWV